MTHAAFVAWSVLKVACEGLIRLTADCNKSRSFAFPSFYYFAQEKTSE